MFRPIPVVNSVFIRIEVGCGRVCGVDMGIKGVWEFMRGGGGVRVCVISSMDLFSW